MNARTPKAIENEAENSATALLLEVEMPNTTAFEAFEGEFDASLAALEERFSAFVTPDSFAGSIGR